LVLYEDFGNLDGLIPDATVSRVPIPPFTAIRTTGTMFPKCCSNFARNLNYPLTQINNTKREREGRGEGRERGREGESSILYFFTPAFWVCRRLVIVYQYEVRVVGIQSTFLFGIINVGRILHIVRFFTIQNCNILHICSCVRTTW